VPTESDKIELSERELREIAGYAAGAPGVLRQDPRRVQNLRPKPEPAEIRDSRSTCAFVGVWVSRDVEPQVGLAVCDHRQVGAFNQQPGNLTGRCSPRQAHSEGTLRDPAHRRRRNVALLVSVMGIAIADRELVGDVRGSRASVRAGEQPLLLQRLEISAQRGPRHPEGLSQLRHTQGAVS